MTFVRFGLIVTGQGEARFLPELFRLFHRLPSRPPCHFEVIRRIGQRTQRSPSKRLAMVGTGKRVPDRDMDDFGLPARLYLRQHGEHARVLLVDDLEWDRRARHGEQLERYRQGLDAAITTAEARRRAGVFFLVMMLEAYYFGDPEALCDELQLAELPAHLRECDVETIRHPKNELKALLPGFHEIEHGQRLIRRIDLAKVLAHPERCVALRALLAWCADALGVRAEPSLRFLEGALCPVTGSQLAG